MITVDCPWCDGAAQLDASELHCPECAVTVEFAPQVPESTLAAAA
jgi:hypothetical protein